MKKLVNAWRYLCPRCRKGDLFLKPLELSKPLAMHDRCENCNQRFEPEPGYYFGAMFISYALCVFTLLPISLLCVFLFKWSVNGTIFFVIFLGALIYIWLLRFSRSLWINLMVRFDKRYSEKILNKE